MFELNEQELEQVAGGHGHFGSHSASGGDAVAIIGAAESSSEAGSIVTRCFAASHAANDSTAIGLGVAVDSASQSGAGAGH